MRSFLVYILFFILIVPAFSQNQNSINQANKAQLASNYYRNQEYEKSAELYKELYETTNMAHYFDYYINSVIGLKDYDTAIKELKKNIRKTRNHNQEITLGYVYKEMGDFEQAEKTFDKVIDGLTKSKGVIISIGNNFFNRREFEYAEKTFLKGREILPGEMFYSNLAAVYAYMRDYKRMMVEYLALVREDPNQVRIVESRINSLMRYDFDNSLRNTVKSEIIKGIQSFPNEVAFNRLLIWMFTIEKNYEQALRNSIALDKRLKTEEVSILNYAVYASNNKQFDIALSGLNYLLNRKPLVSNINLVKQTIANTRYEKYIHTPPMERINPLEVIAGFESVFNEIGYRAETAELVNTFAHFLAFDLGKPEQAMEELNKALSIPQLDNMQRSRLKVAVADINVYNNNLWEATFEYAQIIELNKENGLGDEVKLKRAKVSYFLGDIIWAKGQLDILKSSTSKLIANDAMELSLLISTNYELDTIEKPLQLFAKGDLYLFQNNDSAATVMFDSITTLFPNHSLSDKILMRKAGIAEMRFNFDKTASIYEEILTNYPYSTSADDALYQLALLNETEFNNPEKAQELYKRMLTEYPGSIFVADSRKRYRILRGDYTLEEEITPYEEPELFTP